MVKRSTRLAKRNAFKAIEEAIGSSLGKRPATAPTGRDGTVIAKIETQESQPRPEKNKP
jgi:hypothetical protein